MEIFDANVLLQLVIERKQHCDVNRANSGLLVHVCHKMSIPNFKHKMQTWNLRSQSSNCVHDDVQKRILISTNLKMVQNSWIFTNFETVCHEFSTYEAIVTAIMYRRLRTVWTRGFWKSHSEHHSATATTDVDSSILTTSHDQYNLPSFAV